MSDAGDLEGEVEVEGAMAETGDAGDPEQQATEAEAEAQQQHEEAAEEAAPDEPAPSAVADEAPAEPPAEPEAPAAEASAEEAAAPEEPAPEAPAEEAPAEEAPAEEAPAEEAPAEKAPAPEAPAEEAPAPEAPAEEAAAPAEAAQEPAACDGAEAEDAEAGADVVPQEESEPAEAPTAEDGAPVDGTDDVVAHVKPDGAEVAEAEHREAAAGEVITDLDASPEAHAEVAEMAEEAAKQVMRSRQASATGESLSSHHPSDEAASAEPAGKPPKAPGKPAPVSSVPEPEPAAPSRRASEHRRSSGTNGARSPRPGTVESLEADRVHPPSPSKIKTGPWLSGTYKLPKSGKTISGEALCEALERMTNAYIDKHSKDSGGSNTTGPTGVPAKTLSQEEYEALISRLYQPKDRSAADGEKLGELLTLKYSEDGKEQWLPVKTVSKEEQCTYMCELYNRCLERKKKTAAELAEKYLKPLGAPRKF